MVTDKLGLTIRTHGTFLKRAVALLRVEGVGALKDFFMLYKRETVRTGCFNIVAVCTKYGGFLDVK